MELMKIIFFHLIIARKFHVVKFAFTQQIQNLQHDF